MSTPPLRHRYGKNRELRYFKLEESTRQEVIQFMDDHDQAEN
jgi:hypothetical protein